VKIKMFRHLWGYDALVDAGYEGVEPGLFDLPRDQLSPFARAAADLGLEVITSTSTNDFDRPAPVAVHLASLREEVEKSLILEAILVNSMSGSDTWSHAESVEFFGAALDMENEYGITILHETHRGRCLFNLRDTAAILRELPGLKVAADFSHWVNVAERYERFPADQMDIVIERTEHIHSRVGYSQGPQVPDSRAPEYAGELAAHEAWWDQIWDSMQARGRQSCPMTPEFGPYPYLQAAPFTGVPVADLREICDWQARRQRHRFEERFGTEAR